MPGGTRSIIQNLAYDPKTPPVLVGQAEEKGYHYVDPQDPRRKSLNDYLLVGLYGSFLYHPQKKEYKIVFKLSADAEIFRKKLRQRFSKETSGAHYHDFSQFSEDGQNRRECAFILSPDVFDSLMLGTDIS